MPEDRVVGSGVYRHHLVNGAIWIYGAKPAVGETLEHCNLPHRGLAYKSLATMRFLGDGEGLR